MKKCMIVCCISVWFSSHLFSMQPVMIINTLEELEDAIRTQKFSLDNSMIADEIFSEYIVKNNLPCNHLQVMEGLQRVNDLEVYHKLTFLLIESVKERLFRDSYDGKNELLYANFLLLELVNEEMNMSDQLVLINAKYKSQLMYTRFGLFTSSCLVSLLAILLATKIFC